MTDELKPCPFCGSSNTTLDYYEISCPQELGTIVVCNDCGASAKSIVDWNTRPIEDALRSQLTARDALIERLMEAGNDMTADCEASWYALHIPVCTPVVNWRALVDKYSVSKDGGEK